MKTKFTNYINNSRKGKEAHDLELESMRDPFLEEAIEGYDSVSGNHLRNLQTMQRFVESKTSKKKDFLPWKILAACVVLGVVIGGGYFAMLQEQTETEQYAAKEAESQEAIDLYVSEAYAEKKKEEMEQLGTSAQVFSPMIASNIVNLEDFLAPDKDMEIYLPQIYLEKKKSKKAIPKATNISNLNEMFK